MRRLFILAATSAAVVSLGGCSTGKEAGSASQPAAKPAAEATECGAERLDGFLGKQATPELLLQIQKTVGHDRIRTLDPGSIVTMDYRSDRLNVDTDADGRILRLRCG